ncbi:DinB family protein [Micromonospora sp. CPCC 206060]|uniref:DinB family protein n=1 Tax=Micromonospora sp. CPCC 206060 TaxID=3122406 RepID=UPI002FF03E10
MTAPSPRNVTAAHEREMLESFVDFYRDELKETLTGVSEADARRRLVPSLTTLIGLVKHNCAVERNWFQHRLLGIPRDQIDGLASADDRSWAVRDDETVADVLAEYDAACAVSRRNAARYPLDHVVPHERLGDLSLRWIYAHMIQELARHAGHADILREQIEAANVVVGSD